MPDYIHIFVDVPQTVAPYICVILFKVSLNAENFLPVFFGQMNESKYYIYKDAKETIMDERHD